MRSSWILGPSPRRRDRLSVRRAVRRRRRRALAGAGAARPALRPRGQAIPLRQSRRDGRRARRGARDPVLAGRQRPRSWLTVDVPEAIEVRERYLPPGERQTLLAGLGARRGVDRRGRPLTRPAHHRPGPAHVLRLSTTSSGSVADCAARVPGATLGVRRDAGLAQQGEPAGQARRARTATSRRRGNGAWTATSCRRLGGARTGYGSRAGGGSSSATSPRCSGSASSRSTACACSDVHAAPQRGCCGAGDLALSRRRRRARRWSRSSAARGAWSCCGRPAGGAAR